MRVTIFTLLFFIAFSCSSQGPDYRFLKNCYGVERPAWDRGMRAVSLSVYPVMPATVGGILAHGYFTKDDVLIRSGFKSAITIGLASGITTGLKYAIKRKRPFDAYPDAFACRDEVGPLSFPSGHTTVAFASATSLTLTYKKWYVALPSFAYAGLVGYSRMRLGVHYPSDVMAGMLIGIGAGFLTWQLDRVVFGK